MRDSVSKSKMVSTQGTTPKHVLCLPHTCKHVSEHVCTHTSLDRCCKHVSSAISHRVTTPWTKIWRHLVICYPTQHCKDQICAKAVLQEGLKGNSEARALLTKCFVAILSQIACKPYAPSQGGHVTAGTWPPCYVSQR